MEGKRLSEGGKQMIASLGRDDVPMKAWLAAEAFRKRLLGTMQSNPEIAEAVSRFDPARHSISPGRSEEEALDRLLALMVTERGSETPEDDGIVVTETQTPPVAISLRSSFSQIIYGSIAGAACAIVVPNTTWNGRVIFRAHGYRREDAGRVVGCAAATETWHLL